MDFQFKKEQPCLFKPEENIQNIYGTPALSDDVQNRYKSSLIMNNVSPIEKQQVGPGLNIDSNVAAAGGFHQNEQVRAVAVPEIREGQGSRQRRYGEFTDGLERT